MASRIRRTRLATTLARAELANAVNRVAFGGERIVLKRHGKDFAAIVSLDDLERLEAIEDAHWTRQANQALVEAKRRGQRPLSFEGVEWKLDAVKRRRPSSRRSRP